MEIKDNRYLLKQNYTNLNGNYMAERKITKGHLQNRFNNLSIQDYSQIHSSRIKSRLTSESIDISSERISPTKPSRPRPLEDPMIMSAQEQKPNSGNLFNKPMPPMLQPIVVKQQSETKTSNFKSPLIPSKCLIPFMRDSSSAKKRKKNSLHLAAEEK